jgi:hypothetical protein
MVHIADGKHHTYNVIEEDQSGDDYPIVFSTPISLSLSMQ